MSFTYAHTYRCKSDEDLIGSVELITYLSAAEEHQSELARRERFKHPVRTHRATHACGHAFEVHKDNKGKTNKH